jgi:hypothetical protein
MVFSVIVTAMQFWAKHLQVMDIFVFTLLIETGMVHLIGYLTTHLLSSIAMIRQTEGVFSALWKNGLKGIVKREVQDPERWRERCGDINFIIDKVREITNPTELDSIEEEEK